MKRSIVDKILQETEVGYDLISRKFSATRKKFWGSLEFIGNYAKNGDHVLDFGCGNGRLLEILQSKKIEYLGMDVSEKLLEEGRKIYPNALFCKLDSRQDTIPLEADFFNTIYSIAVFHHFPSKEYRLAMAKELFRVLRPGGTVVITVWNLWQKKYRRKIFKNWREKVFSRRDSGANNLDWNDCYISFTDNQGNVFSRFHHAFTLKELKKLFSAVGFSIGKSEKIGNNLVLVVEKNPPDSVELAD